LSGLVDHALFNVNFKEGTKKYTRKGNIKHHHGYDVQSFIYEEDAHIIKKTLYKLDSSANAYSSALEARVFDTCKQNTTDEVDFQEEARKIMETYPVKERLFSVPQIHRFNCYKEDDGIISLIEMDKITPCKPSDKITPCEPSEKNFRDANDFLISNGIHHNDLIVPSNLVATNFDQLGLPDKINTGNMIKDNKGHLWVIDFGSARRKQAPPRGGKSKKSKRVTRRKIR
jgi:hypothetical protein